VALKDLTDPSAVRLAVEQYDRLGKHGFLDKYRFGPSRSYFLRLNGKRYDSKAIVAAAHGFQHGQPLAAVDFSGGVSTVKKLLEGLGFEVDGPAPGGSEALGSTSDHLRVGEVYAREDLMKHFDIKDATINTGIFQPKGTRSVWLFVTEEKTPDRTQYVDLLDGDTLYWQGQNSGRKDLLIINHKQNDLELLLFYRRDKKEHLHAGFRYHGPVDYQSSHDEKPKNFVLKLTGGVGQEPEITVFDPQDVEDGRRMILAEVHRRQGQAKFRKELLEAYGGRCAITGCSVEPILEAAHIYPYRGPETNHVTNGVLLRADLHSLFDLHWLTIDPKRMAVRVTSKLAGTEYAELDGSVIRLPEKGALRPSVEALQGHMKDSEIGDYA